MLSSQPQTAPPWIALAGQARLNYKLTAMDAMALCKCRSVRDKAQWFLMIVNCDILSSNPVPVFPAANCQPPEPFFDSPSPDEPYPKKRLTCMMTTAFCRCRSVSAILSPSLRNCRVIQRMLPILLAKCLPSHELPLLDRPYLIKSWLPCLPWPFANAGGIKQNDFP